MHTQPLQPHWGCLLEKPESSMLSSPAKRKRNLSWRHQKQKKCWNAGKQDTVVLYGSGCVSKHNGKGRKGEAQCQHRMDGNSFTEVDGTVFGKDKSENQICLLPHELTLFWSLKPVFNVEEGWVILVIIFLIEGGHLDALCRGCYDVIFARFPDPSSWSVVGKAIPNIRNDFECMISFCFHMAPFYKIYQLKIRPFERFIIRCK